MELTDRSVFGLDEVQLLAAGVLDFDDETRNLIVESQAHCSYSPRRHVRPLVLTNWVWIGFNLSKEKVEKLWILDMSGSKRHLALELLEFRIVQYRSFRL